MRVFSLEKYIEWFKEKYGEGAIMFNWVYECDGLTAKEINELGYIMFDNNCWMVEIKE